MALRFGLGWTKPVSVGDWTVPGEPHFAESKAFELLSRDLRRYVQDEVAGRSFLVAGHRGAGKTTTVAQAVCRLRSELLADSANLDKVSLGRRLRLQRPLMVKLVGKSLIEPPPRQKEIEQQAKPDTKPRAGGVEQGGEASNSGADKSRAAEEAADAQGASDNVASALVHLTIALYRALAAEVVLGFAAHAANGDPRELNDRLELAAQLGLELDGAPEPALLRTYWHRLGRLERGVLWPARTDQTMQDRRLSGQGMREIIALATAAQAFQVCSGAVTYEIKQRDSASNERKLDTKLDIKDAINRAGALGAGALAGGVVGASQGPVSGVGTGLLVWLLGSLTLNWSSSRQRKSERSLDYAFLRDRTIQTLDRDLPLVIERIREAGLAPVFVIDELDKLTDSTAAEIKGIIERLKHLVSDYGFFCFLTDRNYFDEIERKVMKEAYPTEHTYFSERVLVLNRSSDLFHYLQQLLTPEEGLDETQSLAVATFALAVIFRSKLNFTDLTRELARFTDKFERLSWTEADIQRPGELRLAATVQIAIDQAVRDMNLADRFNADVAFEQLAVDALYYIPRCWEEDVAARLDIGPAAIKACLIKRMTSSAPREASPAADESHRDGDEQADLPVIRDPDLEQLTELVGRVALYLGDFRRLSAAVEKRNDGTATQSSIILTERAGLLRRADGDHADHSCFLLDELANPRDGAKPVARPRRQQPAVAERPVALLEEISKLLEVAELTIGNLTDNRLLPPTVSDLLLRATMEDLLAAEADSSQDIRHARGMDGRLAFEQAFGTWGRRLAEGLALLVQVRHDARVADPPATVLGRISRHFTRDSAPIRPHSFAPPLTNIGMTGTPGSVSRFTARFAALIEGPRRPRTRLVNSRGRRMQRWEEWREHVLSNLAYNRAAPTPSDYLDMIMAVRDEAPGNLFRANLAEMDLIDWSKVAMAGLPTARGELDSPVWVQVAALYALGFDAAALRKLSSMTQDHPSSAGDTPSARLIANKAGRRPGGILHIYRDEAALSRPLPIPSSRPMLWVGLPDLDSHMDGLNWLADQKVIEGVTDETG